MSDEQHKGKSSERDDEEARAHDAEDSEEQSSEERSDEEGSDDEGEGEGGEEHAASDEEGAAAAHRVASALGVGDEDEGEAKEEGEEAPAPNRAARRAEAAQRRKKRKTESASARSTDDDAGDEPLPKDKNARAKELLKRRREQASGGGPRPVQLLPGEMVDDALARGSTAASKWIRENFGIIQWVILGAIAAGGGYLLYQTRVDKKEARATAALMVAVEDDRGRVMAEDKRTDDEKEADPTKVFKTAEERTEAALAAYKKTIAEHPGTAAAMLARLGEGGDYLDKQDWPHALDDFSAVASSPLANADPDVKGRALEGLGFAKEGKGDLDGALATFHELEGIDIRGYKELGLYHQGRIWLAKGDKEKAKDFLKQAHDKLEQPTIEGQGAFRYLSQMVDETLRRIDPSLVPNKAPAMGGPKGGAMTADEIEKLKRQLMEQLKQQQQHKDQH